MVINRTRQCHGIRARAKVGPDNGLAVVWPDHLESFLDFRLALGTLPWPAFEHFSVAAAVDGQKGVGPGDARFVIVLLVGAGGVDERVFPGEFDDVGSFDQLGGVWIHISIIEQ